MNEFAFERRLNFRLGFVYLVLIVLCNQKQLYSQRPTSPIASLAVDEVRLKNKTRLYGAIINKSPKSLSILVERAWFQSTYPKLYDEHFKRERKEFLKSLKTHLDRLEQWQSERALNQPINDLITSEVKRLKKKFEQHQKGDQAPTRFTIGTFDINDVASSFSQPASHRRILGIAWKHKLAKVTTRTVKALERDLEKANVDIRNEKFDLSDEVPNVMQQSDEQWRIRRAMFEYQMLTRLDFQGVGNSVFKVDPERPPKPEDILQNMLRNGAGLGNAGLLDELLRDLNLGGNNQNRNDGGWWKNAASVAQAENVRGFRIIRIKSSLSSPKVVIENWFVARVSDDKWKALLISTSEAHVQDVDETDVARIKDDPQVAQIEGILQGLQLGNANAFDRALRQGAATEMAMKKGDVEFVERLDLYTERTDAPTIPVH